MASVEAMLGRLSGANMHGILEIGRYGGPLQRPITKKCGYQMIILYKADIASSDVNMLRAPS